MQHVYRKHGLKGNQHERVFTLLLQLQQRCCGICGENISRLPKGQYGRTNPHYVLYIDHCHATGMIRGLLCGGCNGMLAFLEDSRRLELFPDAIPDFERWHAAYLSAILTYMRVDRWFPRKDTASHIQRLLEQLDRINTHP